MGDQKMGKDWKSELASFIDEYRVIESCIGETLEKFDRFCEFIAEPAFDSLKDELKIYNISSSYHKEKGKSIGFQIEYSSSLLNNFAYTLLLPRDSIELKLKVHLKAQRSRKDPEEEVEFPFLDGLNPDDVLEINKEDLIRDVIKRFRSFCFKFIL
jgi:hypothetical protein